MDAKTFSEILKFNPYHDSLGRFASAGFKGTLYHGSPETDIEEFDIDRAGKNTSSGEKLIYFTDSKQMADDFSYERLDGSTMFTNRRGKKGRVYEVDVEMKHPLDFRNLTDEDVDNILKLDAEGLLTKEIVRSMSSNHQLLKASLNLNADSLKKLGYDGLIANTGKAGHNSLEYAVVDSKQAKIKKSYSVAKSFDDILKFNPYHDSLGRFTTAGGGASFTIRTKDPSKQGMADSAIAREKERNAQNGTKSPRMQSVHEIEDKIRDQFYESAAIVDIDGNVLLYKGGSVDQVGFTKAECDLMKGNTLTHNHPNSSIFSVEDTFAFVNNDMQEIRATTREGLTYSISRGNGYTYEKGKRFVIDYDGEMKSARIVAQRELDSKHYYTKIIEGEITQNQANKDFGKVVTREMKDWSKQNASKYGINFSVEKREVKNNYNTDVYTGKSANVDFMVLDDETDRKNDESFNEWLNRNRENEKTEKSFSIYKTDDDKRLVFGWASISITVDGEQLEDHQQDMIDPEDLEEAAYEYVLNFRDTGEEHVPTMRKKGKLVESCVFTAEKQKAMGIPEGILPVGWWIGFKIEDDDAWQRVKDGTYRMFSIEGRANREPVEKSEMVAKTFDEILKFNPYHDSKGRFASESVGGATVLFNSNHFNEIANHPDIKGIVSNRDYEYYGIRVQEEDTETVGNTMTHHSVNAGGDFDNKDGLEELAGELDGVSTIGINNVKQVGTNGGYEGKIAYLLGSNESPEIGYDPGEAIMKEPTVLAKIEYKNGKIIVTDKVHIEAESKPKPAKQTESRHENPGYKKFMAEMKAKYGDDIWSRMTDSEMDAAERWENHRYDPVGKSAVANTIDRYSISESIDYILETTT